MISAIIKSNINFFSVLCENIVFFQQIKIHTFCRWNFYFLENKIKPTRQLSSIQFYYNNTNINNYKYSWKKNIWIIIKFYFIKWKTTTTIVYRLNSFLIFFHRFCSFRFEFLLEKKCFFISLFLRTIVGVMESASNINVRHYCKWYG